MKYKYILYFPDGEKIDSLKDDGEVFDTEEEAEEEGLYAMSCAEEGADILHMSNPGDYPEYTKKELKKIKIKVIEDDE